MKPSSSKLYNNVGTVGYEQTEAKACHVQAQILLLHSRNVPVPFRPFWANFERMVLFVSISKQVVFKLTATVLFADVQNLFSASDERILLWASHRFFVRVPTSSKWIEPRSQNNPKGCDKCPYLYIRGNLAEWNCAREKSQHPTVWLWNGENMITSECFP